MTLFLILISVFSCALVLSHLATLIERKFGQLTAVVTICVIISFIFSVVMELIK